ncbi:MAG TPA: histidinol dehydrogenase [Clostridiaceae bacterium]|jgi:histidinol dehydrogenase|nr:histidinol dehydrogenase [Clostridiaceae bacterium]
MINFISGIREINEFLNVLSSRKELEAVNVKNKVREILDNVKTYGDKALIEYTKQFDGVELTKETIRVSESEIDEAYKKVDGKLIDIIRRASGNIRSFHEKIKEKSWIDAENEGILLGQIVRPLEIVGIYVPGGTAPLISTILMTAIPAKVAGVEKVIMATPPGGTHGINPYMLVAAREAGVASIYRVGGAQAVCAMALGTETIEKVDKIAGPGNIYVAEAKRSVYGYCDIDMVAGPSEILVIADESANPAYIAADLLSQAEHDIYASSILVTVSQKLAEEVREQITTQLEKLDRKDIIQNSLKNYSAIILCDDIKSAVDLSNKIAPEHLELCVANPFDLIGDVRNAGAIFLGSYAPEPLGDYFAGPNHVLPTGGSARFFSPLCTSDFLKKSSVIYYTEKALFNVYEDVAKFAEAEGLSAHANAVRIRFS